MKYPYCWSSNLKTLETRDSPDNIVRRRKECVECGKRLTSYEYVEGIGSLVLKYLKKLDRVAYIRFALVYRQFEEPEDFKKLLDEVRI